MKANKLFFPEELVKKIVKCVEDAVGDDILEDIRRNELQTTNSVPTRIWDLLNKNLISTLETEECTIAIVHRGPWEMLIIFEKTTQCIFTFMREKRFEEIRKKQRSRKNMHYVDMLAKQFNQNLLSDYHQTELFAHNFSDENKLGELVQNLLQDLAGDIPIVRNHILVLFEAFDYQLIHIRAVKVTPNLDIAQGCDQDWSNYISANESMVVDKVDSPEIPENQPNRGLTLKAKAIARKKDRLAVKRIDQEKQKEN